MTTPQARLTLVDRAKGRVRRVRQRVDARRELRELRERFPEAVAQVDRDEAVVRGARGYLRLAQLASDASPRMAARHNLDIVLDVCTESAIPYFALPEPELNQFRIAIPAGHWSRFIDALVRLGRVQPIYFGVLEGADRKTGDRRRELTHDVRVQDAARHETSLEVYQVIQPSGGGPVLAARWACLVEQWVRDENGALLAPSNNGRTTLLGRSFQKPKVTNLGGRRARTVAAFTDRGLFDVDFPIDVVYMWVNDEDPAWRERRSQALAAQGPKAIHEHAVDASRFRDGGELRYSLRSLELYAPWVRRVFLVTDGQRPSWLTPDHPWITVVDHTALFGDAGVLPSFNSHAIGARLHHIRGLSEHYLHFNDDFFLGRAVHPSLFFQSNGASKFFLSRTTLGFLDHEHAMPHEQARRNVVNLLRRDFGRSPTNNFFHTPITQRRSTMFELEERYPDEFQATWSSQFRSEHDFEINSWLHHSYGYLRGQAVPGRIKYDYFALDNPKIWARMAKLARGHHVDTFCINDSWDASEEARQSAAEWLERYFPVPSSMERRPDPGDERAPGEA